MLPIVLAVFKRGTGDRTVACVFRFGHKESPVKGRNERGVCLQVVGEGRGGRRGGGLPRVWCFSKSWG